ncbi:MAG: hypothetical protein E7356_03840 [Clostridiales bacterium]|nr:hypothetical protein [Clostridiales bacterium]
MQQQTIENNTKITSKEIKVIAYKDLISTSELSSITKEPLDYIEFILDSLEIFELLKKVSDNQYKIIDHDNFYIFLYNKFITKKSEQKKYILEG